MTNRGKTIQARLILLLVVVLVPVIGIQTYMYWAAFQERKTAQFQSNLEIARAIAKSFDTFVGNLVKQELSIGLAITSSPKLSTEDSNRLLLRIKEDNPALWEIFWVSPTGVVLSATGPQFLGMNLVDREYFKKIVAGQDYVISDLLLSRTTQQPSFTVSRGIRDEKGVLLGIVTIAILPERLNQSLGIERFKGGGFAVVDSKSMLVFRYPVIETTWEERNWLKPFPQFGDALKGKEVSATVYAAFEGKNRMVSFTPIPSIGWAASAGQREEDLTGPVLASIARNAVIIGLMLMAAFFLALAFSRRIANPVAELRQYALALGGGEGRKPFPVQSISEFKDLADAFDTMAEKVRSRETALKENEQKLRSLFESSPDAVFMTNTDGSIDAANPSASAMLGWSEQEFRVLGRSGVLDEEDPRLAAGLEERQQTGRIQARELTAIRKGGERFPVEVDSVILPSGPVYAFVIMRDITERKEAEEALRKSEAKLLSLFQNSPDAIFLAIPGGPVTNANPAACVIFGMTEEELCGVGRAGIEDPSDPRHAAAVEERARTGRVKYEATHVRKDGSKFPSEVSSVIVDGGSMSIVILRDITERKHAEEEIRKSLDTVRRSEEHLRVLIQHVGSGVALIDEAGKFPVVNREFLRIFGLDSESDILNINSQDWSRWEVYGEDGKLLHVDDHPVRKAVMTGKSVIGQLVAVRNPGANELTWMLIDAEPLVREDGTVFTVVSTYHDITERKRMEEELAAAQRQVQSIIDNTTAIIYAFDLEERFLLANTALAELLGSTPEQMIGKRRHEFMPKDDADWHEANDRQVIETGKALEFEEYSQLKGRSITWLTTKFPLRDTQGRIYAVAGISTDVSERKKMEEELRNSRDELGLRVRERTEELRKAYEKLQDETAERERTEAQLRQSHKMEAIGTLTGGVAHDFNNILAAIIGFTELVVDHVPKESREAHHLKRVMESSLRGRDLVRQMLTYSRKAEQEKKPLSLSNIVKDAVALIRATTPTTIIIKSTLRESEPILADPTQIQQIIMNLCTNAAHAMREKGGTLDIQVNNHRVSPSNGNPHGIYPGLYTRLTVRDTGTGMSPDIINKIFDPFFTTKELGEGTGLGLSVVHGIVKQSNGHIIVESEPGRGSTFTVYFPQIGGELEPEAASDDEIPTGSERILFIDDEEALVEMGEDILAELGYEVTSRMNGKEALALFKEDPSRFDLIITDQTMPEMTGIELAKEVLALRADMPVIMCTGFNYMVNEKSARALGISAFAMKPLTKREIARTIRKVLDE